MAFKAGAKKDPDSPTLMEAIHGEHGEEYREAMVVERSAFAKGHYLEGCAKEPNSSRDKHTPLDLGV